MALRKTVTKRPAKALPELLGVVVAVAASLQGTGVLEEVQERLEIRRSGGYVGFDGFLFLLVFWLVEHKKGLKTFYNARKQWWPALAATFQRRRLPSPPSLSRLLDKAELDKIIPFGNWLLTNTLDLSALLRHPACMLRDGLAKDWVVFDYDLKHKGLRQRALPAREEHPDAVRKAQGVGSAGIAGRKRGEMNMNRSLLTHAGSALLVHIGVGKGSGKMLEQLCDALLAARQLVEREFDKGVRVLVRADGAYGGPRYIRAFLNEHFHFLVRGSRYSLFGRRWVKRRLRRAEWAMVPDSGSGPQRSALDLGLVLLEEGLRVRVVVSRYPVDPNSKKKGKKGFRMGDAIYELYFTNLTEGWTAEQVVSTYYGRCGYQENRFAQTDREAGFDRIFSYNLGGQLLATLVGAFVWNYHVVHGFLADPPSHAAVPAQEPAMPKLDEREWQQHENPDDDPEDSDAEAPGSVVVTKESRTVTRKQQEARRQALQPLLPNMLHGTRHAQNNWKVLQGTATLLCPGNQKLPFSSYSFGPDQVRAIFVPAKGTCADCPLACGKAGRKGDYKLSLRVPLKHADTLPRPTQAPATRAPEVVPLEESTVSFAVQTPLFLPAEARRRSRANLSHIRATVLVPELSPKPSGDLLIARTKREQRHGRCTRAENNQRYALPDDVEVHIHLELANELPRGPWRKQAA